MQIRILLPTCAILALSCALTAQTPAPAAAPDAAKATAPPMRVPLTPDQQTQRAMITRTAANPALPSIFLVGDSTADYNSVFAQEGAGIQGWGVFLPGFFDLNKVNVVDAARAGRSSRTYISDGFWDAVAAQLKPGDYVLIQLGQNDVFALNDATRARGTIPGNGDESQEIDNMLTHKHEVVHTYGWYIRKIVAETRAKGATPILLSLTTRNAWNGDRVEVGVNHYRDDLIQISQQQHVDFVDVSAILAHQYEKFGKDKVYGLYHDKEPVHMDTPGSLFAAYCTVGGLKALPDAPLNKYLAYLGQFVLPMHEPTDVAFTPPAAVAPAMPAAPATK